MWRTPVADLCGGDLGQFVIRGRRRGGREYDTFDTRHLDHLVDLVHARCHEHALGPRPNGSVFSRRLAPVDHADYIGPTQ